MPVRCPSRERKALLAIALAGSLASALTAQAPHWAFVPPTRVIPAVRDSNWCRDDLDRCVLAGLEANGMRPSPPAEPALLLRRVHLVLTGLPPTPAAAAAFLADPSDAAYERTVDALLASDACAEHLATLWLDLARFADTYGYQADFECRTWPWRDWLLRAFASDMPWDRFVQELLAGDLLLDATTSSRTATAFWRLHRQTNEGGSIDEEWRHEYIADRVDTFGATFLGLTVGCARCHDHKSDPITQRDYYALGSFFAIDEAGLYPYTTGATPQPAIRLTTPEQDKEIARLQAAVTAAERKLVDARDSALDVRGVGDDRTLPEPLARFPFATITNGRCTDERKGERQATVPGEWQLLASDIGPGLQCDGDARLVIPNLPTFTRADAFSVRLRLWCPDHKERAVLLHTCHYTEDADTQGYQILLKDGRLCWEIVHHWPGSAIAVSTKDPLPLQHWCDVVVTYDGSSRAAGLTMYLDGAPCAVDVVRDHLAGPATVRQLELGGRDRDRGFNGGRLSSFELYGEALSPAAVAALAGREATFAQWLDHGIARSPTVVAAARALRDTRHALHQYIEAIPELMVLERPWNPPQRFVLRRGAYDQPDRNQPVQPDVPACLPALPPLGPNAVRSRLHLADWLNDPRHPLAARVVVDRLWALCFGRGLVATPDNFGRLGERPRQQALLDVLAVDFAHDRSQKRLLRRIVTSATFRQASGASPEQREQDPYNELLARVRVRMAKPMEIRLHGRGGQGGVTCAKILAAVYASSGKSVQTFGDYAGERSGAPVRAYTRVSDEPITNRNKVYEPDHLLVLDPHLIGPDVFAGLRPGGRRPRSAPVSPAPRR